MDNYYTLKPTMLLISGFQGEKLISLINKLKYLNKKITGLRFLRIDLYLGVADPTRYISACNCYRIRTRDV